MQALAQAITGVPVVSLHHDIRTVTGEAFTRRRKDGVPGKSIAVIDP